MSTAGMKVSSKRNVERILVLSERGASFYVPYMGVSLNGGGGTPKTP